MTLAQGGNTVPAGRTLTYLCEIRAADAPLFIMAQLPGALTATFLFGEAFQVSPISKNLQGGDGHAKRFVLARSCATGGLSRVRLVLVSVFS